MPDSSNIYLKHINLVPIYISWTGSTIMMKSIFHHFDQFSEGMFVFWTTLNLSNLELSLITACTASLDDFFDNALALKLTWKIMNYSEQGSKIGLKLIFRGKVGKPRFSHRRCTKRFFVTESASHHVEGPWEPRATPHTCVSMGNLNIWCRRFGHR